MNKEEKLKKFIKENKNVWAVGLVMTFHISEEQAIAFIDVIVKDILESNK